MKLYANIKHRDIIACSKKQKLALKMCLINTLLTRKKTPKRLVASYFEISTLKYISFTLLLNQSIPKFLSFRTANGITRSKTAFLLFPLQSLLVLHTVKDELMSRPFLSQKAISPLKRIILRGKTIEQHTCHDIIGNMHPEFLQLSCNAHLHHNILSNTLIRSETQLSPYRSLTSHFSLAFLNRG